MREMASLMEGKNIVAHPILTRNSGEPSKQKEYALNKDLTKLSRRELLDLKNRQLKLLENKSWLKRLPDKGEKIQNLYDKIIEALDYRTEVENASKLLSSLNLGSNNLNNLEWEGTVQSNNGPEILDSDDDEAPNPFEILASSNSVHRNKRLIKNSNCPNEKPLITEKDIREAKEIQNGQLHLDPVIESICQMEKLEPEHRFLPYKSTELKKKGNTEDQKTKQSPKKRDITAATPPVIQKGAVALSLRESIAIEFHHQSVMKDLLEKQAAERLEAKMKELKAAGLEISAPPKIVPLAGSLNMSKYRIQSSATDDDFVDGASDDEEEEDYYKTDTLTDDDDND